MKIILIGILLDLIFGDPYAFPHPVKFMGAIITREEKIIRKKCKTNHQLFVSGIGISVVNMILGFFIPVLLLHFSYGIVHELIGIYIVYSSLSMRMLAYEAKMVKKELNKSLKEGQNRLQYIVGRDTSVLSKKEVIQATIETVAENTADGVIAPLFFIVLFGPAGGWLYKFVNTMDSMIGYKNDKYEYFGKASAIIDDIFNFIPARITSVLMIISSFFSLDGINGIHILKRDRKNHLSPNAGYPESAVAGLLGIQLGGGHYYFGKYVPKPTIGEPIREVQIEDIDQVIFILYKTTGLATILITILYIFIK